MSFEVKHTKSEDEDFSSGLLLRDIEEISKALYLHETPRKSLNSSFNHRSSEAAKTGLLKSKSDVIIQDTLQKYKKLSLWNWKSLKAFTQKDNHRFNCCFFLHVHAIEGLAPDFDNLDLCVTWKRKDNMLRTHTARVSFGMAEFEETLLHQCTVQCSRAGIQNAVKYEPKLFSLHVSVIGAPLLDLGDHLIDLSRLLPLTLEELEDKRSSGKWMTSFKLTNEAKGAMLNVTFGFSILNSNSFRPGNFAKVPDSVPEGGLNLFSDSGLRNRNQLLSLGSVPRMGSHNNPHSANAEFLKEIFPDRGSDLSHSVKLLYQKLNVEKMSNVKDFDFYQYLESLKPRSYSSPGSSSTSAVYEFSDTDFDRVEEGVEESVEDHQKMVRCGSKRFDSSVVETIDVAEIFSGEEFFSDECVEWNTMLNTDELAGQKSASDACENRENSMCTVEADSKHNSAPYENLTSTPEVRCSMPDISKYREQENCINSQLSSEMLSLDDVADSIENDFLNMLSVDQNQDGIVTHSNSEPYLVKLFQEDNLAQGNHVLDTDFIMAKQKESSFFTPNSYKEVTCSKSEPYLVQEDNLAQGNHVLDTNFIMAKQKEPSYFTPNSYKEVAFGDDFDLSCSIQVDEKNCGSVNQSLWSKRSAKILENLETEALMYEWGLNEDTFQYSHNACSGGFGSPVYVPAEEPLKLPSLEEGLGPFVRTKDGGCLRSMNPLLLRNAHNGARLIVQGSSPVVLPAAMGFSVMDVLYCWASVGAKKMCIQANELMPMEDLTGKTVRQAVSQAESCSSLNSGTSNWKSEVVLESIDGKNVDQSSDTISSCLNSELDYVSFENLVPMVITIIEGLIVEGLKIQSGMPDIEAPSTIRIEPFGTSSSTTAAKSAELSYAGSQVLDDDELIKYSLSLEEWIRMDSRMSSFADENTWKLFAAHCTKPGFGQPISKVETGRSCGVLDNNFVMGLRLQLRDPLRNYEMVGSPMLILVQVERVFPTPRQESKGVSSKQEKGANTIEEPKVETIHEPLFKISDACIAGLIFLHSDKQLWGSSRQQQSGYRWLHSNGMAKTNKSPGSKAIVMRKSLPVDVLWSISFPIQNKSSTWDEHIALNGHVRNPDIVFPN